MAKTTQFIDPPAGWTQNNVGAAELDTTLREIDAQATGAATLTDGTHTTTAEEVRDLADALPAVATRTQRAVPGGLYVGYTAAQAVTPNIAGNTIFEVNGDADLDGVQDKISRFRTQLRVDERLLLAENLLLSGDFSSIPNPIAVTDSGLGDLLRLGNEGVLTLREAVTTEPLTVSTLPTGAAGMRAFVSDSTLGASGNFGAVVVGSGSNSVPVYHDGTSWKIG